MFDLLVVATDGSESGARAVDTALDLARRFDADVNAVSVVDTEGAEPAPEDREDGRAAREARAERAVEAVATAAPDEVAVSTAVREGRPAETIVSHAAEVDADGVALGTRGRGGDRPDLRAARAHGAGRAHGRGRCDGRRRERLSRPRRWWSAERETGSGIRLPRPADATLTPARHHQ
jgi:nucleotide-binding universal stress UspA family protein